uniref:Uncharacterized protein n=1 Tax=Amphimedon queenslandica TaxID=400682 RepID=A0A1X7THT9_AMPQE
MVLLSEYAASLPPAEKSRYINKLERCRMEKDPYVVQDDWHTECDRLPDLAWHDITSYMVCTPSPYTKESIKASYWHAIKITYK